MLPGPEREAMNRNTVTHHACYKSCLRRLGVRLATLSPYPTFNLQKPTNHKQINKEPAKMSIERSNSGKNILASGHECLETFAKKIVAFYSKGSSKKFMYAHTYISPTLNIQKYTYTHMG